MLGQEFRTHLGVELRLQKNNGQVFLEKTPQVGQRSFFTVACVILCIPLGDLDAER